MLNVIKRIEIPFPVWCKSVVGSDKFVVLDTETTGTERRDQIVELAIVNAEGIVLYDRLMQPSCPISPGAMNAHHITESMLEGMRCFKEQWPEIEAAIAGRAIITYNAVFDSRMFRQSAIAHNVMLPEYDWYCAMAEYARFWGAPSRQGIWLGSQQIHKGNAPYQKLQEACRQQCVEFEQKHRALGDTLATLALIKRIAELGEKAPTYHTRERDWWE
jgi:DNA polymerase-3 subunit epsilon